MSNFMQLVMNGEKDFGKVLAELLTDPVDRSLFDSGGIYGVRADRHAAAAELAGGAHALFEAQPTSVMTMQSWGLEWHHNLYHWLQEKVDYRPDITRQFYDFVDFCYAHNNHGRLPVFCNTHSRYTGHIILDNVEINTNYTGGAEYFLRHIWWFWPTEPQDWDDMPRDEWESRMDMLGEWLRSNPDNPTREQEDEDDGTTYTYNNGGNMLSQDFQYYCQNNIYAISIHGGADARGGFSDVIFCEGKEGWYDLSYITDGSLYCNDCDASWYTNDGGYHIYDNHYDPSGETPKIDLNDDNIEEYAELDEEGEMTGRLLCPVCKTGVLHGSF